MGYYIGLNFTISQMHHFSVTLCLTPVIQVSCDGL